MSDLDYHDHPAVSYHDTRKIKDPATYYLEKICAVPGADKACYRMGRGYHCLTLEGMEAFLKAYVVVPQEFLTETGRVSTKKEAREWKANQFDKTVISPKEFETYKAIANAVWRHKEAARILTGCQFELERFWIDRGTEMECKAKADAACPGARVIDLKGCYSLDTFERDTFEYGYCDQLSYYTDAFEATEQFIIAVEKDEPHRVGVWSVPQFYIKGGYHRNHNNLQAIARCRAQDNWTSAYASILTLNDMQPH